MHAFAAIVETSRRVYEAARILDVPVLVTEQYPKVGVCTVRHDCAFRA